MSVGHCCVAKGQSLDLGNLLPSYDYNSRKGDLRIAILGGSGCSIQWETTLSLFFLDIGIDLVFNYCYLSAVESFKIASPDIITIPREMSTPKMLNRSLCGIISVDCVDEWRFLTNESDIPIFEVDSTVDGMFRAVAHVLHYFNSDDSFSEFQNLLSICKKKIETNSKYPLTLTQYRNFLLKYFE
ncbi:hypothetical protein PCE1_002454 [Barthelona sp. PCE]